MNLRMRHAGSSFLCALALTLSFPAHEAYAAAKPASAGDITSTVGTIDRFLAEAYPAGEPGAAVLVEKDGKVVLRKGYGLANVEHGIPVRPETVFALGSVTKQFTAAAILLLEERGKLSVEDELTKHLPDYPTHGKQVTIEHLLTHTSGIPSYTGLLEWLPRRREDLTVDQLLGLFKDLPSDFEPGTKWAYNWNGRRSGSIPRRSMTTWGSTATTRSLASWRGRGRSSTSGARAAGARRRSWRRADPTSCSTAIRNPCSASGATRKAR